MYRIRFALVLLATAFMAQGAFAQGQAAPLRIAYVNINAILEAAPAAKAAEAQWAAEAQVFEEELQAMLAEIDSLRTDYEQKRGTMTPDARLAREQLLQQKEFQLNQRNQELVQQSEQRQMELVSPVYQQIGDMVEAIRVEGNYSLILDSGAQAIIAADPALDLTDAVLARLQAGSAGGGSDSAPGGV